jgi:hypothetical protein
MSSSCSCGGCVEGSDECFKVLAMNATARLISLCHDGELFLDKYETNALLGEVSEYQSAWESLISICNNMEHIAQFGLLKGLMAEYMSPVK